jgi:hypothetical protein
MSLNTANYYTLIINNDPSWSAFPKRNVIASTEPRNPYPGTYVLLPYDGTKIGVCLSYDIWMSFHTIPAFDVAEFNRNINGLLRIGSGLGGMAKIDSIKLLKAATAKFEKYIGLKYLSSTRGICITLLWSGFILGLINLS